MSPCFYQWFPAKHCTFSFLGCETHAPAGPTNPAALQVLWTSFHGFSRLRGKHYRASARTVHAAQQTTRTVYQKSLPFRYMFDHFCLEMMIFFHNAPLLPLTWDFCWSTSSSAAAKLLLPWAILSFTQRDFDVKYITILALANWSGWCHSGQAQVALATGQPVPCITFCSDWSPSPCVLFVVVAPILRPSCPFRKDVLGGTESHGCFEIECSQIKPQVIP